MLDQEILRGASIVAVLAVPKATAGKVTVRYPKVPLVVGEGLPRLVALFAAIAVLGTGD